VNDQLQSRPSACPHHGAMGNTPVGICTKQQVEVAVIHSYHPILHAFSTLLPSRYHIPFCPSVVALVLSSIICPIMSTAAGGSWRLEGEESNSSALEFFFGVVLPLSCCSHLSFILVASLSFVICIFPHPPPLLFSSSVFVHHLLLLHHLSLLHRLSLVSSVHLLICHHVPRLVHLCFLDDHCLCYLCLLIGIVVSSDCPRCLSYRITEIAL